MRVSSSFSVAWPDPNSPVLSKIDFGVPLVELLKWLDVRDTFLGDNCRKQDIAVALALARDCNHPDAEWLTSIFEGKDVSTKGDAREVFILHENDARALCFAWWLTENRKDDLTLLRRSSEMGNAFACATLCGHIWYNKAEFFRLAQFSASHHERDGIWRLGDCFKFGTGCEKDLNLAKQNFYFIAAELGHVQAASTYGYLLDRSDPARWIWHGRAALRGSRQGSLVAFVCSFPTQVERFFSGSGNATVVFFIGRALKDSINVEKKEILGWPVHFNSLIGPANQAVSFHDFQIKSARLAVDTWTLISTRLHVIKDMRIFIGKMIWEGRFEANYKVSVRDLRAQKRSRK